MRRINYVNGSWALKTDWEELVEKPRKQGYYIEAFGSAGALIDEGIEVLLKITYRNSAVDDSSNQKLGYVESKGVVFGC